MPSLRFVSAALGLIGLLGLALPGCPSDPKGPPDTWSPAFDANDAGWLLSLWGPSTDELYAVGGDNQPSRGVVMRRRGEVWSEVELGVEVPLLNWVTGFGADDVIFVGDGGTIVRGDGETWSVQESPTEQDLWGVWGSAPDDVWAVGGVPFPGGAPTIVHFDGDAWTLVETPALTRENVFAFFKVWGSGPDDVWVVGQRGVVLRWDGSTWAELDSGVTVDLISVWGTGPDRVAMVGGRGSGWIATWNGTELRSVQPPALPGLNGVWMQGDAIHVAGEQGELARFDFDTLALEDEFFPETNLAFHVIYGDGERLTAVGGNFSAPNGPFLGIAYERAMNDED